MTLCLWHYGYDIMLMASATLSWSSSRRANGDNRIFPGIFLHTRTCLHQSRHCVQSSANCFSRRMAVARCVDTHSTKSKTWSSCHVVGSTHKQIRTHKHHHVIANTRASPCYCEHTSITMLSLVVLVYPYSYAQNFPIWIKDWDISLGSPRAVTRVHAEPG